MCAPGQEFQAINPSTQVALFSECMGACESLESVSWVVYHGMNDSTTGEMRWDPLKHPKPPQTLPFFGERMPKLSDQCSPDERSPCRDGSTELHRKEYSLSQQSSHCLLAFRSDVYFFEGEERERTEF